MNFLSDQEILSSMIEYEQSAKGIADKPKHGEAADEEDPFIKFIDFAQSILSEAENENSKGPGWSWIASRILKTCVSYSSGVTPAILLSDLSQAWNEHNRGRAPKKRPEYFNKMKEKHRRVKLPGTVTIDLIYEKRFLSLTSVIEAVIIDLYILPGTDIYMITLGDFWSSNTIDLYLHRRFYKLADPINGILKKGREVFLTGCHLRTASGSSAQLRLLPTEYFVVLLDEDQDDDAMLLGAQFCSDSFSSISLEAVKEGVSYSLYAKIEAIESLETQGKDGSLQRKLIMLVDNDGVKSKFLLWGEQVLLCNLFSVGSMLALDRPFVASSCDSAVETCEGFCLEYGSATRLYMVPFLQHEEQVSVALTQSRSQVSRLFNVSEPSQGSVVSQVTLPCDSQGSINFSHYPFLFLRTRKWSLSVWGIKFPEDSFVPEIDAETFSDLIDVVNQTNRCLSQTRISCLLNLKTIFSIKLFYALEGLQSFVADLRDKMTNISLFGVVTNIVQERITARATFSLELNDTTGTVWIKLYFVRSWSLGRLALGHTVYVSGLTSSTSRENRLQLSWMENDSGASFVNLSCLPALLNSSCLHKLSCLSDLSIKTDITHVCRVWLDRIEHFHVHTRFLHSLCGKFIEEAPGGDFCCNFCDRSCSAEVVRSFHLKITLADESAKVFAWCISQTAAELLQISPDDFDELPEEEQIMYPSSLKDERFTVAIVNCRSRGIGIMESEHEKIAWEITRAAKL